MSQTVSLQLSATSSPITAPTHFVLIEIFECYYNLNRIHSIFKKKKTLNISGYVFFFSDEDNIGDVQVVEWHVCKIIKSLTDEGFTSFCGYIILKAHFVLLNIYEIIFS